MSDLCTLPNIGKTMEKRLASVGISDVKTLKEVGSKEAFMRLRLLEGDTCFCSLCGLEGAVQGIRWHYLDDKSKKDLKRFFASVKN